MARSKSAEEKKHLTHALIINKRPPIWTYLKTKDRDKMRERKRHWRTSKLGKKIKKKVRQSAS